MRILFLVHQFPPQFTTGTENVTLETARAMVGRGHKVEVLAAHLVDAPPAPNSPLTVDDQAGLRVHRYPYYQIDPLPPGSPFRADYNNPAVQSHLRQVLHDFQPDLVHAFHLYRLSAAALDTIAEFGLPVVFTVTDFWPVCPALNLRLPDGSICGGPRRNSANCLTHLLGSDNWGWTTLLPARVAELAAHYVEISPRRRAGLSEEDHAAAIVLRQHYMRKQLARPSVIIAPSNTILDKLTAFGISAAKVRRLPYGLNLDYIHNAPERTASDVLRVAYIGTISKPKGLHVLARALRRLPASLPLQVKIYGRLTDDPRYVDEVRTILGTDPRATFHGAFPNLRVGEILAGIDVLVVPSTWLENTPLVISEAQAAKIPVIASNLSGMAEQIQHDVNGLLFPAGDDQALAEQIERVVSSRSTLERYSAASIPPKSIREYASDLEGIYREILGTEKASP